MYAIRSYYVFAASSIDEMFAALNGPEKYILSAKNFNTFVKELVFIWLANASNWLLFIFTLNGGFIVLIGDSNSLEI